MKAFPMMCQCPDGATRIAKDHLQMSAFMGAPYGPDGKLIQNLPPTLETVLAAGYGAEAAANIVRIEAAKAEQGVEPYGDKPYSEFVDPEPPQAPVMEPISGEVIATETAIPEPEPEPEAEAEPVKNKGGRPRKNPEPAKE